MEVWIQKLYATQRTSSLNIKIMRHMNSIVTPTGKAVYPHVNEPNFRFDTNGMYSIKLHLSEDDFNAFKANVDQIVEAQYSAECAKQGGKKVRRSDSSPIRITSEGDFEVYAKQAAKKDTKKGTLEFSVGIFDSKARPSNAQIGGGSTVKLAVKPWCWYNPSLGFGYTLQLQSVQVLELVEFSSGGNVFGEEDGSYEAESFGEAFAQDTEDVSSSSAANF